MATEHEESNDEIMGKGMPPDSSAEGDMGEEASLESHHERLAAHDELHKSHHERLLALEGGMSDTDEEEGEHHPRERKEREERLGKRKRH